MSAIKEVHDMTISHKFCRFLAEYHIYTKKSSILKYHPGKFIFSQLLINFANFQKSNSVHMRGWGWGRKVKT